MPTSTASPLAIATVTPQPDATASFALPTLEPTIAPPTPHENGIWRPIELVPPGSTITGLGGVWQFTIAANVPAATTNCPERTEAHVWTSDDGYEWFDVFVGKKVFGSVDVLQRPYGHVAIGRETTGCGSSVPAMWAPTDKADWYQPDVFGLDGAARLTEAVGTLSQIVVTGIQSGGAYEMGAWTSDSRLFDFTFVPASRPPGVEDGEIFGSLIQTEAAIVGFDVNDSDQPVWYSMTSGDTWQNADFEAPFWFWASDAVATDDQVLAAGQTCCLNIGERVGFVFRSTEGIAWRAEEHVLLPGIPEAIVGTDGLLVALGRQVFVSRDGIEWHIGPPIAGYAGGETSIVGRDLYAAIHGDSILVATPAGQVWIAALADLDPQSWPALARVERPRVGDSKRSEITTHCGAHNGALNFDLRNWVPDPSTLVDGEFPPSFGDPSEPGIFTFAGENRLEFEGSQGDVVVYHPTEDPPRAFPCA